MKALVTGGSGFTGSHLVKELINKKYRVRVLARAGSKVSDLKKLGASIAVGDISNRESVFNAVRGVDRVFNIAAAYREATLDEKIYWDVNHKGTINILDACLKYNVPRLVHCSTIGVVSSVKDPPGDETASYSPDDAYQRSKCKAEEAVLKYIKEKSLRASIIRPCAIYGPGDLRLLKMFKMAARKKIFMFGNGNALFHMVFIDDLVNSFILASEKNRALGEVFIIGHEKYTTLNELFTMIAGIFNISPGIIHIPLLPVELLAVILEYIYKPFKKQPPLYRRRVAFFKKNRAFDISKAKKILGFKPGLSLEQGLKITADWYLKNGYIK